MADVYTASWGVALGEHQALPVRISLGSPNATAKQGPWIGALIPFGIFNRGLSWPEFSAAYRDRLDSYGVEGIRTRIESVAQAHPGRPLLLSCFERDPAECHRGLLGQWWYEQTGDLLPEWPRPEHAQRSQAAKVHDLQEELDLAHYSQPPSSGSHSGNAPTPPLGSVRIRTDR